MLWLLVYLWLDCLMMFLVKFKRYLLNLLRVLRPRLVQSRFLVEFLFYRLQLNYFVPFFLGRRKQWNWLLDSFWFLNNLLLRRWLLRNDRLNLFELLRHLRKLLRRLSWVLFGSLSSLRGRCLRLLFQVNLPSNNFVLNWSGRYRLPY